MSTSKPKLAQRTSSRRTGVLDDASLESLMFRLKEMEQRSGQLTVVNAIAQVVARSPEISDILEQSLNRLLDVMDLEGGAIFLLDESKEELVQVASVGFSEQYNRGLHRIKVGDQLTGRVARYGQPIFVEDISKDRRITSMVKKSEDIQSFAGIPLHSKDRLLGVMNVISKEFRRFDPSEVSLLSAVGDQLAVAIDNAHLFEQNAQLALVEERNWLAREIHDTLAQGLVALVLQLELAITMLTDAGDIEKVKTSLRKALELARENLEEARRSVLSLRGDRMTRLGLAKAVRELLGKFSQDTGIIVSTSISRRLGSLPINVEEGLYRIAQEALANVRKHSEAKKVRVSLQRRNGEVHLMIRDDGVGFNPTIGPSRVHFGIRGMGERAGLLRGRLDIQSRPGHGSLVRAVVPVEGLEDGGGPISRVQPHSL